MGLHCYRTWRIPAARVLLTLLIVCLCSVPSTFADKSVSDLQVTLNATEISRRLLHSTIVVESGDDVTNLLFPKWIPGLHGPTGPIENVAGFRLTDRKGATVVWERDYADPFRFKVSNAAERYPMTVDLTYICSQPTDLSWGSDCDGLPTMGVINWNTVTIYPEGSVARDFTVRPRLILPSGWRHASALPLKEKRGDTLIFEVVSYEELIDMPVICGRYVKTYNMATTASTEYFIHVAVDQEILLPYADTAFSDWSRLADEAEALFGRTHFDEYHFLVPVSDSISQYGLEHRNSSVNSGREKVLTKYGKTHHFLQYVMPHEFVHAWCAKYRRPAGMSTHDYQIPKNMALLWVYEGLTTYLGDVLAVRSGLVTADYLKDDLAFSWGNLRFTAGRQWRSLEDIARTTHTVWRASPNWAFHRRGADYYPEGALLWLEVDARIREATNGERSLDDFCRSFFGTGDKAVPSIPFEQSEIVATLAGLVPFNWDSLLTAKVTGVSDALDETGLNLAGYTFASAVQKPKALSDRESRDECRYYYESIGCAIDDENNVVLQVVPGSPADAAGLYSSMKLLGVNGKTFSYDRLEKGIRDAVETRTLTLLAQHGELLSQLTIAVDRGLLHPSLKQITGQTAWFDKILKPKRSR